MRLLTVVYGTLTVFLHVHLSPLDQHLVHFGTAATYGLRLGHNECFESVSQYPAHWLHPQSSASVLCASFVRALSRRQVWLNPAPETWLMVEVVANSVAWSRRVFASSDAQRICISAHEFNRKSSLVILKNRKFFDEKRGQKKKKVKW